MADLLSPDLLLPWERKTETLSVSEAGKVLREARDSKGETDQTTDESVSSDEEQDRTAGEEAEVLEGDDSGDEAETAEQAEASEGPQYVVEIDGEKWTADDVRSGVLRQADYTRKTQAIADEKRRLEAEVEAERSQIRADRDKYADRLKQLSDAMSRTEEPDWDKLAQDDPANFQRVFAAHQKRVQQLAAVRAELERVDQERLADFTRQRLTRRQVEGQKLLEAMPEWADEKVQGALVNYATTTYHFSNEDLASVDDHRLFVILDKARRYDELQARGRDLLTDKQKQVKVLNPGSPQPRKPSRQSAEVRTLRERAQRTGRIEDVVALQQAERATRR